jgi:cytidyltransferase-like protein
MKRIFLYNEINELIDEINKYPSINWGLTGMHANPIHKGHIDLLADTHAKTGALIVALNNDESSIRKHGYSFMSFENRAAILSSIAYVDYVIENPFDTTQALLSALPINVYLKGGDVDETNLHPGEAAICKGKNIKIIYGMGGSKTASSSNFLNNYYAWRLDKNFHIMTGCEE